MTTGRALARRRSAALRPIPIRARATGVALGTAATAASTATARARARARVPTGRVGEELVDEVLEHQCRLCEGNLAASVQELIGSSGGDADVVGTEQPRSLNSGVAVIRNAVVAALYAECHDRAIVRRIDRDGIH